MNSNLTNPVARLVAGCVIVLATALPLGAQTIAITGGRVFPVSGPPIEGGTVIIRDGKITAVGSNVPVPADAQRVDAAGKWVTPGFINSSTQLGVIEVSQVSNTRDMTARGKDNIAAAFTKPISTGWESRFMSTPRRMTPNASWNTPDNNATVTAYAMY